MNPVTTLLVGVSETDMATLDAPLAGRTLDVTGKSRLALSARFDLPGVRCNIYVILRNAAGEPCGFHLVESQAANLPAQLAGALVYCTRTYLVDTLGASMVEVLVEKPTPEGQITLWAWAL